MQTSFYNLSTSNNPLLGNVTIGSYHSINNFNKYPNNTIKSPLPTSVSTLSLQSKSKKKNTNRLSFLTQSSHSEEEIKTPLTPKSLQHNIFDINHHESSSSSDNLNHSSSFHYDIQYHHHHHHHPKEKEEKINKIKVNNDDNGSDNKNGSQQDILKSNDDFEMIRSKITGITRAMQAFHVQELFYHEPTITNHHQQHQKKNNKHKRYHTAPDQSMCNPFWQSTPLTSTSQTINGLKDSSPSPSPIFQYDNNNNKEKEKEVDDNDDKKLLLQNNNNNNHDEWILNNTFTTLLSTQLTDHKASDIYFMYNQSHQHSYPATPITTTSILLTPQHSSSSLSTSPPLPSYSTGKELIDSNKNEQEEEYEEEQEQEEIDEQWQQQFLSLMGTIVKHSEQLECLSTDLLRAESHVRQLLSMASTVQDQFEEREKQYEDRLKEIHVAGQQQLIMIDALEDLAEDMNMKLDNDDNDTNSSNSFTSPPSFSSSSSSSFSNQQQQQRQKQQQKIENDKEKLKKMISHWFKQVLPTSLFFFETESFVIKTRWYAGMILGSDVGTGDLVPVLSSHQHHGIEIIVSGFGIIIHDDSSLLDQESTLTTFSSSSPSPSSSSINSNQHKMMIHQYLLYLSPKDRQQHFLLLPKNKWVPDILVDECQLEECSIQFSLFQRKHHCRRCGKIICQRHSGNRLPLFKQDKVIQGQGAWHRICDICFMQAISI
ncbi:unnamed protein product [Cunninghamella echinulata]